LTTNGNGLMPLDRTQIVGNRGGHLQLHINTAPLRNLNGGLGVPKQAADTQSALTPLRETLSRDVSIEG
jgi:hypothetical protein